ncbi:sugar isomerase [Clostridium perfringens]|nr:sugar isomerase [Clostridium perfringens]
MRRGKKLLINTITSLLYQVVSIICGFILPSFFLRYYGSEVNGLVASITQFLGFITLAECGVGAVVQSTLYKPLAEKNNEEISKILVSSERFFKKIAYILLVYIALLCCIYPLITLRSFNYIYTLSLILVISISSFAQYYFSMTYRLLLFADQLAFIQLGLQIITLILNTIFSVILMKVGANIQIVKLVSTIIFMIQPLILYIYVKRNYNLDKKIKFEGEPIKQKWNGLAQHIASVVLGNSDVVVLTLFSTLANVSIYTVYYLVINGIKQLVLTSTSGVQAMFGNMYVKREYENLNKYFSTMEWIIHSGVTVLFSCTGILIVPFIKIYTLGISDANYDVQLFAILITVANASYCLRLPYNIMVLAAGHYRETQMSAIIEASINVVLSVILVSKFGLIGVAIGTFVAMIYRTTYLAWYLSKNILYRKLSYYYKHLFVDILSALIIVLFIKFITFQVANYYDWISIATKVTIIAIFTTITLNLVFYKRYTVNIYKAILNRIRK